MHSVASPVQAYTFGEILDRAFAPYRYRLGTFAGLAVITVAPTQRLPRAALWTAEGFGRFWDIADLQASLDRLSERAR